MFCLIQNYIRPRVYKTFSCSTQERIWGWLGGAMVLGNLPVQGRPTILITVGQGPIALAVGAGGGWFGHFYSHLSFLLFLPLFGRRPNID